MEGDIRYQKSKQSPSDKRTVVIDLLVITKDFLSSVLKTKN